MSFEVIETQEQLDKVIGARIERAKEAAKAEFQSKLDELDTLTTKLEEKESKITSLSEELETAKAAKTANEAKIADLTAKVQKYEADSVKTRIAQEFGLDAGLANRLTGETEEDIRKDAEALKGIVGSTSVQRINYNPESTAKDEENAALKNMLQAMKGE